MDVSIIIVNYNTCQLTLNCLKSIYQYSQDFLFEVIVVDNRSNDNSIREIESQFPDVIMIEANENLGFGKANNLGVKAAKGNFLLFINSDTVLLNNAILLLLMFYKKNHNDLRIGALGSYLLDSNENLTHSFGTFPTIKNQIYSLISSTLTSPKHSEINTSTSSNFFKVDYITGAFLMMDTNLFKSLNGFNPSFFMYFEETDLLKRMNVKGLNSYILFEPKVIHLEGASFDVSKITGEKLNRRRMMFDESKFIYLSLHNRKSKYIIFRLLYFILRLGTIFDNKYIIKERIFSKTKNRKNLLIHLSLSCNQKVLYITTN